MTGTTLFGTPQLAQLRHASPFGRRQDTGLKIPDAIFPIDLGYEHLMRSTGRSDYRRYNRLDCFFIAVFLF